MTPLIQLRWYIPKPKVFCREVHGRWYYMDWLDRDLTTKNHTLLPYPATSDQWIEYIPAP